jgi:hypothetical protein
MGDGKREPEGRGEPSRKHTAIDVEMKKRMIRNYEGGQSLSAIARGLHFVVSTIVNYAACIRECAIFIFHLIHVSIVFNTRMSLL